MGWGALPDSLGARITQLQPVTAGCTHQESTFQHLQAKPALDVSNHARDGHRSAEAPRFLQGAAHNQSPSSRRC